MPTLVLPDPSLVVLIGAAGSGKSTLAARLFAAQEIVSSDALRAVVSGDEGDQDASGIAFRILHRTVAKRLATGRFTVVDATNVVPSVRRPLIARARAVSVPVTAIVLDIDPDAVRRQNAGRIRVVDPDVVERHLAGVRSTVDGRRLEHEGVDQIVIVRTGEEAEAMSVERVGRPRV
ncbi:MAG TPA: AAA family ATPase [Candidatus Limnocylindrales bacterium]|nr:AAA family ATPase [Candidatus Limnocylindrales bacterium]